MHLDSHGRPSNPLSITLRATILKKIHENAQPNRLCYKCPEIALSVPTFRYQVSASLRQLIAMQKRLNSRVNAAPNPIWEL